MIRARLSLLALCLLSLAGACSDDPAPSITAIVVTVESDLEVPEEMDEVAVFVRPSTEDDEVEDAATQDAGLDAGTVEREGQSVRGSLGDGGVDLPVSVVLKPSEGVSKIEVTAVGYLNDVEVLSQTRSTSFVSGRTLELPLMLSNACKVHPCPEDMTCVAKNGVAFCEPEEIDPGDLTPPGGDGDGDGDGDLDGGDGDGDGDGDLDGGMDAGDAAAPPCVPTDEVCNGLNDDCDKAIDEGETICAQDMPFAVTTCRADDAGVTSCQLLNCVTGYLNCDGDGPGCGTEVSGDNCGLCGEECQEGLTCSFDSTFECRSGCPQNVPNICGTSCVNLDTDTRHCGACTDPDAGELHGCPAVPESMPSCVNRKCKLDCFEGRGSCDEEDPEPGTPEFENGCETDLNKDRNHCGDCETICQGGGANTVPICNDGECDFRCETNFIDCDDNPNDCETVVSRDNCYACGNKCSNGVAGLILPEMCCSNRQDCAINCGN